MSDWQHEREELACALRWAARLGMQEGVCNHFSLALPAENGGVDGSRFLINPYGLHWSEVKSSDVLLCDQDGAVLEGAHEVEKTAFFIHARLHLAAPQAKAVFHTHMPYATALTLREDGRLAMCEQNALMFYGRLAYDDVYNGLALDEAEGDRLARGLGNKSTLMLASHGVICTGETIAEAFSDLYYLECAARAQILAQTGGHRLRELPQEVQEHTAQQMASERALVAERLFAAYRRMLDKEEPDYRH